MSFFIDIYFFKRSTTYLMRLWGDQILTELTPILGEDWRTAEKVDNNARHEMVYIMTVNADRSRQYELCIKFTIKHHRIMVQSASTRQPVTYTDSRLRFTFWRKVTTRILPNNTML
jgi:hypothetical protein